VIDRPLRDELARALRALASGEIRTGEFTDLWPIGSRDLAACEIWKFGCSLYGGPPAWERLIPPSRLVGNDAPNALNREATRRCLLFLSTDLSYEWPAKVRSRSPLWVSSPSFILFCVFGLPAAGLFVASFLPHLWVPIRFPVAALRATSGAIILASALGQRMTAKEDRAFWTGGEPEVWPFLRRADYEAARDNQSL
jgi:hypothetical protein